ncbi:hypothetical protein [Delftia sp. PS-11]|uniref:hypothetical protein n=1 Tax=Delftia sp. PS-11 TaxID=2767222 RepID=UPI00245651DE|nr:hypothetical protein [Delftia sp. PS-11]KAJ8743602.1 hypothetical protein H9T68_16440 [Delftia sp. PS-11]
MVSIVTTYTSFSGTRLAAANAAGAVKTISGDDSSGMASGENNSGSRISASARQLSEATARADARGGMTYQQLSQKAASLLSEIGGDAYHANKEAHDSEVPDTDDPALLARAQQATDFLNGRMSNPFKGVSRDQLALIAYDEGSTFTVNERRAASMEADRQEFAWRQKTVQKAMNEYNSTGKMTEFFSEALEHYNDLPQIEQAQYPEDYGSRLQGRIDQNLNYKAQLQQGKSVASLSEEIYDTLSKLGRVGAQARLERVTAGAHLERVAGAPPLDAGPAQPQQDAAALAVR